MNPRVKEVAATEDYTLEILFDNGEERIFDVTPFLGKGIFKQLEDKSVFQTAKVSMGTVCWDGGQDFCPDTLYLDSIPKHGEWKAVAESTPEYKVNNGKNN